MPMLLIPFVENAFKHGTGFIEGATIQIDLTAEKNILQFIISFNLIFIIQIASPERDSLQQYKLRITNVFQCL